MNIIINGCAESLSREQITLEELLLAKGIVPETVAVEMNSSIIPKQAYRTTLLSDGDKVEVVRYVGGGC